MSIPRISYTRAAQVAILAIATDLYWNQGQVVGAIAFGILGNYAIKGCNHLQKTYSLSITLPDFSALFRKVDNSRKTPEEVIKQALTSVQKQHPEMFANIPQDKIQDFFTDNLANTFYNGSREELFKTISSRENPTNNMKTRIGATTFVVAQIQQLLGFHTDSK